MQSWWYYVARDIYIYVYVVVGNNSDDSTSCDSIDGEKILGGLGGTTGIIAVAAVAIIEVYLRIRSRRDDHSPTSRRDDHSSDKRQSLRYYGNGSQKCHNDCYVVTYITIAG